MDVIKNNDIDSYKFRYADHDNHVIIFGQIILSIVLAIMFLSLTVHLINRATLCFTFINNDTILLFIHLFIMILCIYIYRQICNSLIPNKEIRDSIFTLNGPFISSGSLYFSKIVSNFLK